jgi:hypothetical protein
VLNLDSVDILLLLKYNNICIVALLGKINNCYSYCTRAYVYLTIIGY